MLTLLSGMGPWSKVDLAELENDLLKIYFSKSSNM
jgi:hypothetical protein